MSPPDNPEAGVAAPEGPAIVECTIPPVVRECLALRTALATVRELPPPSADLALSEDFRRGWAAAAAEVHRRVDIVLPCPLPLDPTDQPC
jgi:hypothetical protein